ncbi:MAG: DUF362 domain-containing protein [Planctomycetaceae bacterium]|nr:DUF362 domain-containing protein [Planctomycetaceae bacterium]
MRRKDFLKAMTLAGTTAALGQFGSVKVFAQAENKEKGECDLVAVMNGEPDVMFQKAIAELGGIEKYVKSGQKVAIKPNIGWDRPPEYAANTNPILIKEMVRQCLAAGAKEVVVFDNTCDDWKKSYKNSGIEDAVLEAGGKMLPGNQESYYKEVDIPNGVVLKKAKIHTAILGSDVWFNVPILKTHGGAKMTISLKNYMGVVWDRQAFHRADLQQCIADVATHEKRPALNVVDSYRLMKANGPRGRSLEDAVLAKALFVSPDIVATDTAAVKFFNQVATMPLDEVTHIAKAEKLNLGTMNLDKLNIKRIKV